MESISTLRAREKRIKLAKQVGTIAAGIVAVVAIAKIVTHIWGMKMAGNSAVMSKTISSLPPPAEIASMPLKSPKAEFSANVIETMEQMDSSATMGDFPGLVGSLCSDLLTYVQSSLIKDAPKTPAIPAPQPPIQSPAPPSSMNQTASKTTPGLLGCLQAAGNAIGKLAMKHPMVSAGAIALGALVVYLWGKVSTVSEIAQDCVVGGGAAYLAPSLIPLAIGGLSSVAIGTCALAAIPAAAAGRMLFKAFGWEDKLVDFFTKILPSALPRKPYVATFLARLVPQLLCIFLVWGIIIYLDKYNKRAQELQRQKQLEQAKIEQLVLEKQVKEQAFQQNLEERKWKYFLHNLSIPTKVWCLTKTTRLKVYLENLKTNDKLLTN